MKLCSLKNVSLQHSGGGKNQGRLPDYASLFWDRQTILTILLQTSALYAFSDFFRNTAFLLVGQTGREKFSICKTLHFRKGDEDSFSLNIASFKELLNIDLHDYFREKTVDISILYRCKLRHTGNHLIS